MRNQQSGFTLIELMIGMLVGLIVLSAVIYAFLSSLRSSKDILNSARLNREASVITDMITGEIRRAGYFPPDLVVSGADIGFGDGTADFFLDPSEPCVLVSYYDDLSSNVVRRGFRYSSDSKSILYGEPPSIVSGSCSSLTTAINDTNFISIDNFEMSLNCVDVSNPASSADSSNCMAASVNGVFSRAVSLAIGMSIPTDPIWETSIDEYVKLQNDLSP